MQLWCLHISTLQLYNRCMVFMLALSTAQDTHFPMTCQLSTILHGLRAASKPSSHDGAKA